MKVTEISYRELLNTGDYENISIEMKATVSPEDDLELCNVKLGRKVKKALKEFVNEDGGKK